jgi:DNA-binding IscR family transcriptional regulator
MKLPEKVRLAVDLICFLKKNADSNPRRVKDLAVHLDTSEGFLHQIVAALGKAGMIQVLKGPKGGVLAGFNDYSMLEIFNLFGYMKDPLPGEPDSARIEGEIRKLLTTIVV